MVDEPHGIFVHEFYKDCLENGVTTKNNGRIYGSKTSDYFEVGYQSNRAKYEIITMKTEEDITLKIDLTPHSVKLIELIPQ